MKCTTCHGTGLLHVLVGGGVSTPREVGTQHTVSSPCPPCDGTGIRSSLQYPIHSLDIPGVADAIAMIERHGGGIQAKAIIGPQHAISQLRKSPSISSWGLSFRVDDSLEQTVVSE